jgi:hypothetical protein
MQQPRGPKAMGPQRSALRRYELEMMRIGVDPSGAVEENHSQSTRKSLIQSSQPFARKRQRAFLCQLMHRQIPLHLIKLMPWPWRKPTDIDGMASVPSWVRGFVRCGDEMARHSE